MTRIATTTLGYPKAIANLKMVFAIISVLFRGR